MKRILSAVLLFCMAISLISCGNNGSQSTAGKDAEFAVTEKPLQLSIFMHVWNNKSYDDKWPVFAKAAEMTNISLKSMVSTMATDSQQAYNTMILSGELADIIAYMRNDIQKTAASGAIVPLNDLIEKHAPNLKRFLNENPNIKRAMTAYDGNIYSIPMILDGKVAKGWVIRQDWLDKLNLPVPTTLDEMYMTLKAFKERDPNGNGQADEIPFFTRDLNVATGELLSLFGVVTRWSAKDGKVTYGEYTSEYKNAIREISKWYKEGLIDKEIFTRASNARDILYGDNRGGLTHDWFTSTISYNDKLQDKINGFKLEAIAPPKDPLTGRIFEPSSRDIINDTGWGISSTNKNPVETIKYFDFWFSEEGRRLINYGIEDVHYTMVDSKPKFLDSIVNGSTPALKLLEEDGVQAPIGFFQDFGYEEQLMIPDASKAVRMYMDNDYCMEQFPKALPLSPEEQKIYDTKWNAIDTYIKVKAQKWVMGSENVDDNFDQYIQELKTLGMDEILKVYQSGYERYINQ